ncbi:SHOCT domain-containing protein [Bacillus subtilis]|nr:SHOCT domain-containing protein [Bacillus subtilis]MDF4200463.1 SHOCT domain-containing protein [Bacillus subtilis]MDF4218678.1 SHOCT domain-containing protein [Bacillus subtilis]
MVLEIQKYIEEHQAAPAQSAATTASAPAPSISAADELKKYKELLDMDAITQEEFEIKKKQLLNL